MGGIRQTWGWGGSCGVCGACRGMHENMLNFHGTFGTCFEDGMQLLIGAVYGFGGGPWGGGFCTRMEKYIQGMLNFHGIIFGT